LGGDVLQLADGGIRAVVERVVGNQLTDGAFTIGNLVGKPLNLIQGGNGPVVQAGIIDELTDRAFAAI